VPLPPFPPTPARRLGSAPQALANVSPVTHAIANTLRRVVIMLVSALVFSTRMTALGLAGSGLAIAGSYAYSVAKGADKARAAAEETAQMSAQENEGECALLVSPTPVVVMPNPKPVLPETSESRAESYRRWWRAPQSYDFEI